MAEDIVKRIGGKGNVIIIEGVPGAITAQDRLAGFKEALAKHPNVKLLASQTANYSRAQALQVMENLLQQFPNVDAVLAANDEMALGVIGALQAAGKAGKVLVSGVDGTLDALTAVRAGTLTLSVDYSGYEMGYQATKAAAEYLKAGKGGGDTMIKHTLITKDNVDKLMAVLKERTGQ